MTIDNDNISDQNSSVKSIKSDALFKSIMEDKKAATEFLNQYLSASIKDLINLDTVKIEKESYVEDNLKRRLSDIVFSVQTKKNTNSSKRAFIYILLEQQSTADYWIALRLWKYTLLLCERHMQKQGKLPLVVPILFYNGTKPYNAPKNLWELFTDPARAKEALCNDYTLIDLQATSDNEIKQKQHLGMLEYFMKHIHTRDMLRLWQEFLSDFTHMISLDKESGYIYIKKFLWYTDAKVDAKVHGELNQLILNHLPGGDGEEIMKTIADKYIEQGLEQGIIQGLEKGVEQGQQIALEKTALNMLKQNCNIELIATVTGLNKDEILKLSRSL